MIFRQWLFGSVFSLLWCFLTTNSLLVNAEDQVWAPTIVSSTFSSINNILQFDDTNRLLLHTFEGVYLSKDQGKSWDIVELKDNDGNNLVVLTIQEFDNIPNTAFIFTNSFKHYFTRDAGETWNFFELPVSKVNQANAQINYVNQDYMLIQIKYKQDLSWVERTFYSKDGLKSPPIDIGIDNVGDCTFTKVGPAFTQGDDSTIVCIQREYNYFGILKNDKVIATKDFFKTIIESDDSGLSNSHVLTVRIVESFVVLVVTTDRYLKDSTVLYTSKDGILFHKATFEGQTSGSMFSILDSTPNALYISRFDRNDNHMSMSSEVYRSDSDGRYFKKIFGDVFSNILGMSLISKVEMLDGVWIASHNEVYNGMRPPSAKSMITMDDGENWTYLKVLDSESCKNDEECSLHIAWLTQRTGDGDLKTGDTPGILLGIGNVGKYLESSIKNLSTFISKDGGLSWKKVSDKPTVFGFGDLGNIIVTVPIDLQFYFDGSTENLSDYYSFSLDQGETWTEVKLSEKFLPLFLINNKDNTEKQFVICGESINDGAPLFITHAVDFSDAFNRTCADDDMEKWFARVDPSNGNPICVYGHSEEFARRKSDAKCFVNKNYDDLKAIEHPCECTIKDSECSPGFEVDENGECQPVLSILANFCESDKGSKKLSRRRIIPGNLCTGGYQPPIDDYTLNCKEAYEDKSRNTIDSRLSAFKENIIYYQYLNKNNTNEDFQEETLVVLTASRKAYISFDSESYDLVTDKSILYIFTNPYWPDSLYLVSDRGEILASLDRGKSFTETVSPYVSQGYSSYGMKFDKSDPNVYLLFSNINCDSSNNCEYYSSITEDNGQTFTDLVQNVDNCIFAASIFDTSEYKFPDTLIICSQKVEGEIFHRLISSIDGFSSEPKVLFEKIVGFATSGQYIVVAALKDKVEENETESLTAFVSVDGTTFAEAKLPGVYRIPLQTSYTILEVNSHELFMYLTMTMENELGYEYGTILKANYNGTLFTPSIDSVNANKNGYVDFESVQGLEGLMLVNTVALLGSSDEHKEFITTQISHNDGATWSELTAPVKDANGKSINCKGCFLHLHSYTERLDPSRDTFSSASALGMLFGLGNVGLYLNSLEDENTDVGLFFTRDAGITWKEVVKGRYIWEFGDQGTVLVIVETGKEVDTLKYSLDLGDTWNDYKFSNDKKYVVEDLATVPSDNSLKFILIVKDENTSNSIFTIDFTNVYPRQCELPFDTKESIGDDYEYFIPQHPMLKDQCLFGHEKLYLRRKPTSNCFVGMAPLYLGETVVKNCECTRQDFECDYNYALAKDGSCKLIKGLESKKGDEVCLNEEVNEWWEPTGYRKLQASTCEGGVALDKWKAHACPGKKLDNDRISGWAMFWVIFIPFLAFAVSLIVVYERGIKRNGGFARLGEIRLDEGDNLQLVEENNLDKAINLVIRFGVFSFQLMGKTWRFGSKAFDKLRGRDSSYHSPGAMGAFFNDMVDDDHSLFGDLNDDEDAREIDSFLERTGGDDDNFSTFVTHDEIDDEEIGGYQDEDSAPVDNSEFRLSDEENDI